MNTKPAVTGGAGFIGSQLVRTLLAGGADRVVVIDNLLRGMNKTSGKFVNAWTSTRSIFATMIAFYTRRGAATPSTTSLLFRRCPDRSGSCALARCEHQWHVQCVSRRSREQGSSCDVRRLVVGVWRYGRAA